MSDKHPKATKVHSKGAEGISHTKPKPHLGGDPNPIGTNPRPDVAPGWMKPKNHDDFNNQNDPDVQKLKDKDKFFKKPDGSDTFHDPDGVQQKHKDKKKVTDDDDVGNEKTPDDDAMQKVKKFLGGNKGSTGGSDGGGPQKKFDFGGSSGSASTIGGTPKSEFSGTALEKMKAQEKAKSGASSSTELNFGTENSGVVGMGGLNAPAGGFGGWGSKPGVAVTAPSAHSDGNVTGSVDPSAKAVPIRDWNPSKGGTGTGTGLQHHVDSGKTWIGSGDNNHGMDHGEASESKPPKTSQQADFDIMGSTGGNDQIPKMKVKGWNPGKTDTGTGAGQQHLPDTGNVTKTHGDKDGIVYHGEPVDAETAPTSKGAFKS